MDSSIPTIDDGKLKFRRGKEKSGRRLGWGWFQSGRKGEKKKKKSKKENSAGNSKKSASSKDVKKEHKKRQPEIVSLSQFMRISGDEDTEVAEFSLSPLHKDGVLTLGTSTLPDCSDSLAATKSHNLESVGVGPRRMAVRFLEEERYKQRQADFERSQREKDRVAKLRQGAIENQRKLNLSNEDRNASLDQESASDRQGQRQGRSAPTKLRGDDSVVDKSICVSSKHSVASSIKSGSGQILSPCIICSAAERSHIALPCMHFYFCEKCAEQLHQLKNPTCPVCAATNVAFTRVYTG